MAHDVFISYAAEDKPIADAVCQAIESHGIKCWYAPRDVSYGQDFEESIVDAIAASRLFVLIITKNSNTSKHVKREVQNACMDEVGVPVLPFRVEDVPLNKALKYYIGSVHWLDAITPPLASHLQQLVEHVTVRLPRPKAEAKEDSERTAALNIRGSVAIANGDFQEDRETKQQAQQPEQSSAAIEATSPTAPIKATPVDSATTEPVTPKFASGTTAMDWVSTAIFAISGAVLFLVGSLVVTRSLAALNIRLLYPVAIAMRDSTFGFFLGITVREFFQSARWSLEPPRRVIGFVVHGAAGAVLAAALMMMLSFLDALRYLNNPSPYFENIPRMKFWQFLNFYEKTGIYLPLMVVGFILGVVIFMMRIIRRNKQLHQSMRRPRFTLLFPIAGALILALLYVPGPSVSHGWMLALRDSLFGFFLGGAIAEIHPGAMWAIRGGEKLRAFFGYAATAAAIAMVSSGAVLSTLSSFYPEYVEFYFNNPIRWAIYGFVAGTLIYFARFVYRRLSVQARSAV